MKAKCSNCNWEGAAENAAFYVCPECGETVLLGDEIQESESRDENIWAKYKWNVSMAVIVVVLAAIGLLAVVNDNAEIAAVFMFFAGTLHGLLYIRTSR